MESKIIQNGSIDKDQPVVQQNGQKVAPFNPDIEGFYNRLITEAPYIPGDVMPLTPVSSIPWADPKLFQDGITFAIRNLFPLFIANTAALMFGFTVKPDSVVLLRSGKFHKPENAIIRFLSTGKRISTWYGTNLYDPNSEGFKQIKAVRQLHAHYAKSRAPLPSLEEMGYNPELAEVLTAIKADFAKLEFPDAPSHLLTWDPAVPFSQFDVAMTQFAFVGFVYLFPHVLGTSNTDKLPGFMHFWAVIGRLMGLEDRFNLCLHVDKELFHKLYRNVGLASIKEMDERSLALQGSLMTALSRNMPFLTLKGWTYLGFRQDNIEGENLWKIMGFRDKVCYFWLRCVMTLFGASVIFRVPISICLIALLNLGSWIHLPKGCPF